MAVNLQNRAHHVEQLRTQARLVTSVGLNIFTELESTVQNNSATLGDLFNLENSKYITRVFPGSGTQPALLPTGGESSGVESEVNE
ncbi:hypothetical protein ACJ72_07483 [Emergomyces africanus]|uniref:Uncharacterized protein n=1 Tax=Emergomyces africanus TaxID=1955775 RepID=A0A1B7NN21_9EURO|nr:hypothetical protein ACJ72_07483 [Emergomyces africanus]